MHDIDSASFYLASMAISMVQAMRTEQMFDKQVVKRTPVVKIQRLMNRLGGDLHHVLAREHTSEPP